MITKTKPYAHQRIAYERIHNQPAHALLMEMGTGKSWVTIVDAANLFLEGQIDLMLIVAPNGVHRNWIVNEVPAHLPLQEGQFMAGYWTATESKAQRNLRQLIEAFQPEKLFKIFAINAEAFSTGKGQQYIEGLIKNRRVYMIIDEANQIMKNPKAQRTKALLKVGKKENIKVTRILTGTPVTQGAFDLFAPFKFLDPSITGFSTFTGFKHEYGEFVTMTFKGRKPFQQLVKYKNLDRLKKSIAPYSYRVLKKDCLDLPAKVYEKVYVDLPAIQGKVYSELRDEFIVELKGKSGAIGIVEASLALTRILRLQQILGGFVPVELQDRVQKVAFEVNPKINKVKEIIEGLPKDAYIIIWCRFTDEIKALELEYAGHCVTYYGGCNDEQKANAIMAFQEFGDRRIFIANQQCAGLGLTLTRASTVIYFSNSFSYADRLQSEDRCHRIGQKNKVTYIDLISPNTVDEKILKALRAKKDMADFITGDEVSEWI